MYDVFISYSRKDTPVIDRIEQELKKYGITMFIDRAGIDAGTDWAQTIAQALYDSEVVLFVWSENSNTSENTANEIALAIDYQKTIVPFKIGEFKADFRLSYRLVRFNRIDALPYNEGKVIELGQKMAKLFGKTRVTSNPAPTPQIVVDETPAQPDLSYLELPYQTGRTAFLEFRIIDAFQDLTQPALENYKDAQLMVAEIVGWRRRMAHLKNEHFDPFFKAAEQGDGFALYIASRAAFFIQHDDELNFSLAKLSAEQGCSYGMFELSQAYSMGSGVKKDVKEGEMWVQKAIQSDNIFAKMLYARNLIEGWTVKANKPKGLAMLEKIAEKYNYGEAWSRLGDVYYFGDCGKEKDYGKAEEYYKKAIELGYVEAYYSWAYIYLYNSDGSNRDEKSQQKGYDILMKAAKLNEANAMSTIGLLYFFGTCVKQDYNAAYRWFRKAAEYGDDCACEMLSKGYYYGDHLEENNEEAWKWAQKGYFWRASGCIYMAGLMCFEGFAPEGMQRVDCLKYFNLAIDQGGTGAQNSLLKLYEIYRPNWYQMYQISEYKEFDWVEKDPEKAVAAIRRAAEYDNNDAKYLYGVILTDTEGEYADEFHGVDLLEQAAESQPLAYIRLALLSLDGIGRPFSQDYALDLCEKAREAEVDETLIDFVLGKTLIQLLDGAEATKDNKKDFDDIIEQLEPCIEKKMIEAYQPYSQTLLELIGFDDIDDTDQPVQAHVNTSEPNLAYIFKSWSKSTPAAVSVLGSYCTKFFQTAQTYAEMDLQQALLDLGVCYELEVGVGKDLDKALEYYRRAAELGSSAGAYNAGNILVERNDRRQARQWLEKALELGFDPDKVNELLKKC
ncbi:MAG: toll/interleukin-1 receptor domain-containing protein [Paludibacteraceae bacterium]|nr:toll/interleukin-1 receptor domain-containing protein [Paludibacteraceae bacterium]